MARTLKEIVFRGSAYKDLLEFPDSARREAGHQLYNVQQGEQPEDWKPMPTIGSGVQEIRLHEAEGAFRVIYVARFSAAVFVLHCFQKKSQKTASADVDLATRRYRELVRELESGQ